MSRTPVSYWKKITKTLSVLGSSWGAFLITDKAMGEPDSPVSYTRATNNMIDEKETTIDYDAILGDFDGFLKERNWEGCDAIIDNLRDLGEYSKGIELAKRLTARKMTVPADYGEEKDVEMITRVW